MTEGQIGEYVWAEFANETPELTIPDVVRRLAPHVRGLRAVNVSWDSGRLLQTDDEIDAAWVFQDGYAVTPEVSDALIQSWPYSGCGYDEWYFFDVVPSGLRLAPYCNWCGTSVGEWSKLIFQMDLSAQLLEFKPQLVIGENRNIFLIARDPAVRAAFLGLAREA